MSEIPVEIPPLLYDQPVSERCATECQADVCEPSWSQPYGCGGCCRCRNACHLGHLEKIHTRRDRP